MFKKIGIIMVSVLFLFSNISFAAISKKQDSFDGSTTFASQYVVPKGDFDTYILSKHFSSILNEPATITLQIIKTSALSSPDSKTDDGKWWIFSEVSAELKIDDAIYKTSIVKPHKYDAKVKALYTEAKTSGTIVIDNDIAEKILNAQTLTIRYHSDNHAPTTLNVPTKTLAEWKDIIKATADWDTKKK